LLLNFTEERKKQRKAEEKALNKETSETSKYNSIIVFSCVVINEFSFLCVILLYYLFIIYFNFVILGCLSGKVAGKKKKISKEPSKRKGLAGLLITIVSSCVVLGFLFIIF
jgi:CDP-diglyceride synthetase